jgi:UDP-N-acetylglucosamine 4,6-dehydratase
MMISADDARSTYELDDRYVIEPEFVEYTRKSFSKVRGIKKVDEGFSYASDNNEERLDATGIKDMMKAYLG